MGDFNELIDLEVKVLAFERKLLPIELLLYRVMFCPRWENFEMSRQAVLWDLICKWCELLDVACDVRIKKSALVSLEHHIRVNFLVGYGTTVDSRPPIFKEWLVLRQHIRPILTGFFAVDDKTYIDTDALIKNYPLSPTMVNAVGNWIWWNTNLRYHVKPFKV